MTDGGAPLLALSGVTKRFGGLTALDGVTLQVAAGETVGVIGPNGSGKTTLFATIAGFLQADAGAIRFDDQSIADLRPFRICERGLVRTFQITQPFAELSVADNVLIGALHGGRPLSAARLLAMDTLAFVGLAPNAKRLAGELTLPGRKRLELARALATQPRLILLDEIMAGLRPTEVDEAIELLRAVRGRGITLVVVEHLMRAIVALADRLYVLHHGSVIAEGAPDEVMRLPAVVDAYFGESGGPA
ncbi:MAG: ABC transporter ATP-binding protein [Gammaproteobacteria bacterium]